MTESTAPAPRAGQKWNPYDYMKRGIEFTTMLGTVVLPGSDLRLMSWGDGSGVATSGNNLVIVGIDNNGLLHIRIFDSGGHRVTDTDETKLSGTQAGAISTLKQQIPGFLPPHKLTGAEKDRGIRESTSIVGQTQCDHNVNKQSIAVNNLIFSGFPA